MALYKHAMDEKLRRSENTNQALLNAIPDALMLIDRNKKIVAINEKMAKNMGRQHEDVDEITLGDLILDGSISISLLHIEDYFSNNIPITHVEQINERWIETTIHPVTDVRGMVDLVAIQSHDITEWKHLEEKLEKEGIYQIEQNMEQFQILNDQIRNPLQVISGYISIGDCPFKINIEEQLHKINELVTRLDNGWLESEKVRSFLFRHYQHGSVINPGSDHIKVPE